MRLENSGEIIARTGGVLALSGGRYDNFIGLDDGEIRVEAGGTLNVTSSVVTGGVLNATNGTINVSTSSTVAASGGTMVGTDLAVATGSTVSGVTLTFDDGTTLSGAGTVGSPVAITVSGSGTISPGLTPTPEVSLLTVNADVNFGGALAIDINGTAASQFDRIDVNGNLAFSSGLFAFDFGYSPTAGSSYQFLTMDTTNLAAGQIGDLSLAVSGVTSAFDFSDVQVVAGVGTPDTISLEVINNIAAGNVTHFQGGSRDDVFVAGAGDDFLDGGAGDDILTGGQGSDFIDGGLGSDTLIFRQGDGADTVQNFEGGAGIGDVLDLTDFGLSVDVDGIPLGAIQQDADVLIDLGGGDSILLLQTQLSLLDADDFRI